MKKLLSVVLALLMLAVMLPVTAMAEDTPTLGNDKVWQNVTRDNVQDVLDGKYGSIDNTTIELSAGDYDKIEFGRATEYAGSNTKYYLNDSETTVGAIKQAIAAHPQGGAGTPVYVRSMSNVTLKAADNATVTTTGWLRSADRSTAQSGTAKTSLLTGLQKTITPATTSIRSGTISPLRV